ncbi:exported hypothetical protein [Tenacibaculum sediminilitoris]|uniref:T9SS type A sorting domain-containing protein n=1 Tax=Tenacibaculum sediminilitoris TaxID=1820334 RepID=UPI0038932958
MKKTLLFLCYFLSFISYAQNTYVPDDNFEQALIDLGHDDVLDNYVVTANISSLKSLNVASKNITNLTGIEDFTSLEDLTIFFNQITSLDLSNNRALINLSANNNELSNLNLSENAALKYLSVSANQLTSLDISKSIVLESFYGNNNELVELDLSSAIALKYFVADDNQLTSLNVKNGNNSNVVTFSVKNNLNLTCIQVDDEMYSLINWSNYKDNTAAFKENCSMSTIKNSFLGNVTGSWNESSNWSLGHVPAENEEVEIPSTANVTIGKSSFFKVKKITNEGTLNLLGKLTISNEFINLGRFTYNSTGSLLMSKVSGNGNLMFTKDTYKGNSLDPTKWYLSSFPSLGITAQEVIANSTLATGTSTNKGIAIYNNSYTGGTGWNYFNTLSQYLLNPGKGFAVKMASMSSRYLRKIQENVDASFLLSNFNIRTYKGTQNGWNLIGNPYVASIPANSASGKTNNFLAANGTKFDPAYAALYFWNPDTNSYDIVNNATKATYIKPMEGFFIKINVDVSNVDFQTGALVHLPTSYTERRLDSLTEITLTVRTIKDKQKTVVKYLQGATDGLDIGYDAGTFNAHKKELSIYTNLISEKSNTQFSIQCLAKSKIENSIVPIGIKTTDGEELTIKAAINQLPDGVRVLFEDKLTNTFTDLTDEASEYKIILKEKENNKNRFYLHTKARLSPVKDFSKSDITIVKTGLDKIQIKGLKEKSKIFIYNLQGKLIQQSNVNKIDSSITLPMLAKGMYVINIKSENTEVTKKIIL